MKKKHIFDVLEHILKTQKHYLIRKLYPMKNIPQLLISQDSMDISQDIAANYEANIANVDYQTVKGKGDPKLSTLKNFELLDEENSNNVKVVASFLEKENFVLHIYSEAGLSIYEESFQTAELNLAMGFSNLPKGKYFISLKTSEGELIKEFK